MDIVRRGGKTGRKVGRNIKKPAKMRYLAERRWITNKAIKIFKYMKKHPKWKPEGLDPLVNKEINELRKKYKK